MRGRVSWYERGVAARGALRWAARATRARLRGAGRAQVPVLGAASTPHGEVSVRACGASRFEAGTPGTVGMTFDLEVDFGTATAEIVQVSGWRDNASVHAVAEVFASGLPQLYPGLRRVSWIVAADDTGAASALAAADFVDEGWAPPRITDDPAGPGRQMWTYLT